MDVSRTGGKRYFDVVSKDRGTVVCQRAEHLKRGKVVSIQYMINTDYLPKGGDKGLGRMSASKSRELTKAKSTIRGRETGMSRSWAKYVLQREGYSASQIQRMAS
jgi:hypothetical protein